MDTTLLQDLAMQNVEMVRRAAERNARGLRMLDQKSYAGPSHDQELRDFLADYRANADCLRALRNIADELLREGMEAEAFHHFCEIALEAADIIRDGMALLGNTKPQTNSVDSENVEQFQAQIKQCSEEAQAIFSHFNRLVQWLQIPPAPLPGVVLEKLHSLPPVSMPENEAVESASGF
jgi:hypothetical protein